MKVGERVYKDQRTQAMTVGVVGVEIEASTLRHQLRIGENEI